MKSESFLNKLKKNPVFRFSASLGLAVIVILGLAIISAIGTIVEARYGDAEVAQQLVFHSPYMIAVLGLLCITLIAVMIDRWPWKQHHAGFVLAHIGILILLFGSWMTAQYGIDGSMVFGIGEERRHVVVRERDLMIFASMDGDTMKSMFAQPVNFLKNPPTPQKPFIVHLGSEEMRFVDYHHFAFREVETLSSEDPQDPGAIRFQLENPNVNISEWLRLERQRSQVDLNLGPARVVLTTQKPIPSGQNEIFITPMNDKNSLRYAIYNKDRKMKKSGTIRESGMVETGWMGLKFRILRYLPHAKEKISFIPTQSASPKAQSALKLIFKGQEYWLGVNSVLRLYLEDRAYFISYGQRQLDLNFPLRLTAFRMGKYEGTERAASYESDVYLPDLGTVTISMNEPLYHRGFTFYQSSYEKDETGQPVISVLSVNRDPGRWVKYLGSLLIVLGSIVLFYFKRVRWLK